MHRDKAQIGVSPFTKINSSVSLTTVQPATWQTALLFIVTGVGLYFYFEREKEKVREKKRERPKSTYL